MNSTNIYNDCPEEVLASGPVFLNTGKSLLGRNQWALRKIVFTGIYLMNYDKKGVMKGRWNVLEYEVKSFTAEEVGSADAKFAFGICSNKRTYLFCAVNENDKEAWMKLLSEQISQRKDILLRYLLVQEHIVAISVVSRKCGFFLRPTTSIFLMIMTDASRILLIDTTTEELVDQMVWDPRCPPNATIISEYVLKLQLEKKVFLVNLQIIMGRDENNRESSIENNNKSRNTMNAIFDDEDIPHKPTTSSEWRDLIAELPQTKPVLPGFSGKFGSVLEDVLASM